MDDIARYNIRRWKALVEAGAVFTRPLRDLNTASARQLLDHEGQTGNVTGKQVLCLAGGGGQQSVAFALLGADVTVFDLSKEMLDRDREMASHYDLKIKTVQGDMRDLSAFGDNMFDIVWHPYSLNFVPDPRVVFGEVARVLREGGLYHFNCSNPFFSGLTEDDWNGEGYLLKLPYVDGQEIISREASWVYDRAGHAGEPIPGPREFRHALGTLVNGLIEQGFVILRISEQQSMSVDIDAKPGTWDHFTAVAPPWLAFFALLRPGITGLTPNEQRA